MKNIIVLFLFILFGTISFSQKDPIKWKKLTKEEIELKEYAEPNAPAVILYDYGQMYFDVNPNGENLFIFTKRHVRIKILNEEGLKYAKVKFSYHDMNCEKYYGELSYSLKAVTHNISENGKDKITKIKSKNIHFLKSSNCMKAAEFEFQDVKVGSILEYITITPSLKLIKPDTWYFQNELPVIYSEFRARIPNDFKYIFSLRNIKEIYVQDSSFYDKVLNYRFKYYNKVYNSLIDMSGKEYRFVNKFMPSIKNKKDAEKINIHVKKIKAGSNGYAWEKLTKALMITTWEDYDRRTPGQRKMLTYPAPYIIYYLPSWNELNERLLVSDKFGIAVIKYWDCDSIINKITNNSQSKLEKAESIYNYVKKNMKWNNEYSIYADVSDGFFKKLYGKIDDNVKYNNVGNYFKKGEGTSSEINFVLMHLLKKAKIDVSPILANTFENEGIDKEISQVNQFVSVIALVKINDKVILLDAAEEDSKFNKLSSKYDSDQMFVVRKENFGWISEK